MSASLDLLLLSGGLPPIPTVLKAQLVISCPYAPGGPLPGQAGNVFFMDELDTIWKTDTATADRILTRYVALGANAIHTGPIWTVGGYDGQYDQTNWIGQADRFAAFIDWLSQRIPVIFLVAWPDARPYFNGYDYDMGRFNADIRPVLMHPTIQRLAKAGRVRGMSQWECYAYIDTMRPMFESCSDIFGLCNWGWHNPVWPPHLSPGMGNEDEKACWESAIAAGIGWMFLQGNPFILPAPYRPLSELDHEPRQPIEQTMYDAVDMDERFRFGAHWNLGPRLDGKPVELIPTEEAAYYTYKLQQDAAAAGNHFLEAMESVGFKSCLDGLKLP